MSFFALIILIVSVLKTISCDCEESFTVICANVADVNKYNTESWTELVIGNERFPPNVPRYHINNKFFNEFRNLFSLTVINQIDLVWMDYSYPFLDELTLYKNDMKTVIMNIFEKFPNLKKLNLIGNNITKMNSPYKGSSLKILDLSRNKLTAIQSQFFYKSSLKWIKVTHNQLSTIGVTPFPTTTLVLNLDYNKLEEFNSEVFENLDLLEELTVSHNRLRNVPQVKYLKNVKFLDFSHNNIVTLIDTFTNSSKLTYLDLSYNKISKIYNWDVVHNSYYNIKISLAYNRLTTFDYYAIAAFFGHKNVEDLAKDKNNSLTFYGNPFHCNALPQMETYFRMYLINKSKCDTQYFNSGKTPICIYSEVKDVDENGYAEIDERDYQLFIQAVEKNRDSVQCDLYRDFYKERNLLLGRKDSLFN